MICEQSALVPRIISSIGSDTFGSEFYRAIKDALDIDHCTVFMRGAVSLSTVVAEAQSERRIGLVRTLANRYVDGAYRDDPVWHARRPAHSGECSVFRLSPAELPDDKYRREFYVSPNVRYELGTVGGVDDDLIYVGLYRENGCKPFGDREVQLLQQTGQSMLQAIRKHVQVVAWRRVEQQPAAPSQVSRQELFNRICDAMCRDNKLLTAREAEVCASIMLGYTVVGISMNLGISVNTVSTHRKRAYSKLRISSQNELFGRYVSLVESTRGTPMHS